MTNEQSQVLRRVAFWAALLIIGTAVRIKNTLFTEVAVPAMLGLLWFSSGARRLSSIPNKDAAIYILIGTAIAVGIFLYAEHGVK